ncbi:hypothetical protein B0H14DRAFT_2585827 [Mycena olivaceomarginata]|nr:hypothetical protein B0H14DRAFT_2585827 [Mycena olivaceomarginata]
MGGPFFTPLRAVCLARLFFLIFLTRHVKPSIAVPDREGDRTSDLPKHDESMDIDIVHADVGVVDMDIDIWQANTFATGTSGTCPAATPTVLPLAARANVWTLCGPVAQHELCASHLAAVLYPTVPLAFHSGSSQDCCRSSHLHYRHLCRSLRRRPHCASACHSGIRCLRANHTGAQDERHTCPWGTLSPCELAWHVLEFSVAAGVDVEEFELCMVPSHQGPQAHYRCPVFHLCWGLG